MRRLIGVLVTIFIIGVAGVEAQDLGLTSDGPPYPCPHSGGTYYQGAVFPRYDINTHSLVLIDPGANQAVRVLDTFDENVRIINWSPDCRYLTGVVGQIRYASAEAQDWLGGQHYVEWNYHSIVFWDAVDGGRIHRFLDPGRYVDHIHQYPVIWRPDSQYALVLSGCISVRSTCAYERTRYDFIWRRAANTAERIGQLPVETTASNYNGRVYVRYNGWSSTSFNQYYWDMERGWLWGSGPGAVTAYDVNSGASAAVFPNNSWTDSRFVFSPDGTKTAVYSISQGGSAGIGALTVYDIENMNATAVNVEGFAAPEIPLADYHPVALSADNRYLIAGYDALRVWDLQNLPENVEERLPIYRHGGPQALIWSVRFADWGVIETTSEEGVQRWDLHTGAYIP